MQLRGTSIILAAVGGLVASVAIAGGPVPADLILMEGDNVGGSTVSSVGTPFTNSAGKLGMMVNTTERGYCFWYDGAPTFWADSALPDVLTGSENNCGVGDNGEFIYSPSFNGNDSVYGNEGLILHKTMPAPGHEGEGWATTFCSRPHMTDTGMNYWVSGINDSGGTSSNGRVLYRKAQGGAIEEVVNSRMTIGGHELHPSTGVDFDFHVSGDDQHRINVYKLNTGSSANDFAVFVNDAMVAWEGQPTGGGDNWANFDGVYVNNNGNYIFTGDTDGATSADEFIVYNGAIVVSEDKEVDGVTLAGMSVKGVGLNNLDEVVHIWGKGFGSTLEEHLFIGNGADLVNSTRLLSVGDEIDTDHNGAADYQITDFESSMIGGYGFDLADDGKIYVEVSMVPVTGGEEVGAILCVPEPGTLGILLLGLAGLVRRR